MEYHAIRPHLEFLSMPPRLSLYEPNDPLEFVYFPNAPTRGKHRRWNVAEKGDYQVDP
jgi:hypothetical protein